MGPKKTPAGDETEEIKKSLEFLAHEVSDIKNKQDTILDLLAEVKELRVRAVERDRKIAELERKVEDLEQYSRINDVIMTGLKIKPRSYAQAAASGTGNEEEPSELEANSAEQQVVAFLATKNIKVNMDTIEACHPLPTKQNNIPAVILRFTNRKNKIELMKQGKKLKGTNIYLNDHLTKKNADIAKKARFLRKQSKIQNTWVMNCKIYIKLNGPPELAKVLVVRDIDELNKYE